jgi:hypothetical protein
MARIMAGKMDRIPPMTRERKCGKIVSSNIGSALKPERMDNQAVRSKTLRAAFCVPKSEIRRAPAMIHGLLVLPGLYLSLIVQILSRLF